MKIFSTIVFLLFSHVVIIANPSPEPADLVNPITGTLSDYTISNGNTYPAIALPWGMNFWTPQTSPDGGGWIYSYTARKISGLRQTHQPSPWIGDYGQFSLMPTTGRPIFNEAERASWFSHKAEVAKPFYYKVYLADHDTTAELAPTERSAIFRFTFPQGKSFVTIDAFDRGSFVKIVPEENKIVGYSTRNSGGVPANFKNHFVIIFDKPFTFSKTINAGKFSELLGMKSSHAGAIIGFNTTTGETIHARVASSFISIEQAELNLDRELGDKTFDSIKNNAKEIWNNTLSRIEVSGGSDEDIRTFYSCLYRCLLFPRDFSEITADRNRVHYSPYNGNVLPGEMFTDTGFWDTFRSLFPLLNLVFPEQSLRMQEGFLNAYRESGFFPEWASPGHRGCMIGNNSASVLADAYLKGICVKDTATLWRGIVHGTNAVHPKESSTGRAGFEFYNKLGFVPCDVGINESAARTLEYAYNDWCISKLAKALNRPQEEIELYAKRAYNYKNLFDKTSGLMRGKKQNGKFSEPFSPLKWGGDFTEGNSLHYTWSVFHDPKGLIELMGGNAEFVKKLDSVFTMPPLFDESYYGSVIHEIREMQIAGMGNYAHGNQPIQHMIYLYNYAGTPEKTQFWIREVMDKLYSSAPDGYCGDEDNGQTSAWFVFSALGFYPVCPGSDEYAIGTPLFPSVKINYKYNKSTILSAPGTSSKNRYIKSIQIDGNAWDKNIFTHSQLQSGGEISFEMSSEPAK